MQIAIYYKTGIVTEINSTYLSYSGDKASFELNTIDYSDLKEGILLRRRYMDVAGDMQPAVYKTVEDPEDKAKRAKDETWALVGPEELVNVHSLVVNGVVVLEANKDGKLINALNSPVKMDESIFGEPVGEYTPDYMEPYDGGLLAELLDEKFGINGHGEA